MAIKAIDPMSGNVLASYDEITPTAVSGIISDVHDGGALVIRKGIGTVWSVVAHTRSRDVAQDLVEKLNSGEIQAKPSSSRRQNHDSTTGRSPF
jgi:hypothetical protein